MDLTVNGRTISRSRPGTTLRKDHTYRAVITVTIDKESSITHYWLGDSEGGWGANGDGPVGVDVLQQGGPILSGQDLVLLWRPTGIGRRSLVLTYDGVGPPPYRRESRTSDSVIDLEIVA